MEESAGELGEGLTDGGVLRSRQPPEETGDVTVGGVSRRSEALELALGLVLKAGEAELGFVDGLEGVVALGGQLADMRVEAM